MLLGAVAPAAPIAEIRYRLHGTGEIAYRVVVRGEPTGVGGFLDRKPLVRPAFQARRTLGGVVYGTLSWPRRTGSPPAKARRSSTLAAGR